MLVKKGWIDIKDKMLRCVGTIKDTFENSQTRYFRLLRFAVKYDFKLDEEILKHINSLDFKKDIYVFLLGSIRARRPQLQLRNKQDL